MPHRFVNVSDAEVRVLCDRFTQGDDSLRTSKELYDIMVGPAFPRTPGMAIIRAFRWLAATIGEMRAGDEVSSSVKSGKESPR